MTGVDSSHLHEPGDSGEFNSRMEKKKRSNNYNNKDTTYEKKNSSSMVEGPLHAPLSSSMTVTAVLPPDPVALPPALLNARVARASLLALGHSEKSVAAGVEAGLEAQWGESRRKWERAARRERKAAKAKKRDAARAGIDYQAAREEEGVEFLPEHLLPDPTSAISTQGKHGDTGGLRKSASGAIATTTNMTTRASSRGVSHYKIPAVPPLEYYGTREGYRSGTSIAAHPPLDVSDLKRASERSLAPAGPLSEPSLEGDYTNRTAALFPAPPSLSTAALSVAGVEALLVQGGPRPALPPESSTYSNVPSVAKAARAERERLHDLGKATQFSPSAAATQAGNEVLSTLAQGGGSGNTLSGALPPPTNASLLTTTTTTTTTTTMSAVVVAPLEVHSSRVPSGSGPISMLHAHGDLIAAHIRGPLAPPEALLAPFPPGFTHLDAAAAEAGTAPVVGGAGSSSSSSNRNSLHTLLSPARSTTGGNRSSSSKGRSSSPSRVGVLKEAPGYTQLHLEGGFSSSTSSSSVFSSLEHGSSASVLSQVLSSAPAPSTIVLTVSELASTLMAPHSASLPGPAGRGYIPKQELTGGLHDKVTAPIFSVAVMRGVVLKKVFEFLGVPREILLD